MSFEKKFSASDEPEKEDGRFRRSNGKGRNFLFAKKDSNGII